MSWSNVHWAEYDPVCQFLFVLINGALKSNLRSLEYFGLKPKHLPRVGIYDADSDMKWLLPEGEISTERVRDFCQSFLNGELKVSNQSAMTIGYTINSYQRSSGSDVVYMSCFLPACGVAFFQQVKGRTCQVSLLAFTVEKFWKELNFYFHLHSKTITCKISCFCFFYFI